MTEIEKELINILGINALELNSSRIINMGKTISYLEKQMNMIAKESKDVEIKNRIYGVLDSAERILKKPKAN